MPKQTTSSKTTTRKILASNKTFTQELEDRVEDTEGNWLPESERKPFTVMGVEIGTGTGWDMMDTFCIVIYSLELNATGLKWVPSLTPDYTMPNNRVDLSIDFDKGTVAIHDDDGTEWIQKTDWSVFNQEARKGWAPTDRG